MHLKLIVYRAIILLALSIFILDEAGPTSDTCHSYAARQPFRLMIIRQAEVVSNLQDSTIEFWLCRACTGHIQERLDTGP